MLQLIRSRNALQFRACAGFLTQASRQTIRQSQTSHQSSLPKCAIEPSQSLNDLQIGRLINELSQRNEFANRLQKSMHVLLSKKKRKSGTTPEEEKDEENFKQMLEDFELKAPDRPVNPKLKSSLNPDYDPHSDRPTREQLEEFYKYIEKTVRMFRR